MKRKFSIASLLLLLMAVFAYASTNQGKVYNSDGIQLLPTVGLHSSGHFAPLLFSVDGELQTTTSDSSYNPIVPVSSPISSGRVVINTPDGKQTFAAPLAGVDSNGDYQPLLVDGSGKLIISSAGSGIMSLNGLTNSTQLFASGTAGSDFGISSSASTHTFNLPTASATKRGLLSSADWSTFNNKQAAGNYLISTGPSAYYVGPGRNYTTIQAALNAIGNAASLADLKAAKIVYISGGVYDEDLVIPHGQILTLVAEGTVILGNGAGTNWSSTNARTITATFDNADAFGSDIKPALTIMALPLSDPTSTFLAEAGTFRISGAFIDAGNGLTHTINFSSVQVDGAYTKTATGLTNLQGYRWLQNGAVNAGTATILERCYDCQFNALVTVDGYNAIINSELRAGMTVATNYNTLPPSGFLFTTFSGAFTGPASSLKLDLASDYFFRANSATLGGSATKVLLAPSATSAITGVLTSTDWSNFNGKQAAGNYITALTGDVTAAGPGSVAASVALIGGSSAANVHKSEAIVNAGAVSKDLYVGCRTDSYTADGSLFYPFKGAHPIADALAKIVANGDNGGAFPNVVPYVIHLAACVYTENVVIEDNLLKWVTLQSDDNLSAVIDPPSGNAIQSTANNGNLIYLALRNITLMGPVVFHGVASGIQGDEDFVFDHVLIEGSLFEIKNWETLEIDDTSILSDAVTLENLLSSTMANGSFVSADMNISFNAGDPLGANIDSTNVRFQDMLATGNITAGDGVTLVTRMAPRLGGGSTTMALGSGAVLEAYSGNIRGNITVDAAATFNNHGAVVDPTLVTGTMNAAEGYGKFTSMLSTQGLRLGTTGSQPSCDASHRGLMWNVQGGAGVADVFQVCQKDAADAYAWATH